MKHLFDNNTTKRINPAFAEDKAFPFFKSVYSSHPNLFNSHHGCHQLKILFSTLISIEEIRGTIKRSNASSTPSPLDQIPYRILKRCPSLVHALFNLYNQCWQTFTIPQAWRTASIRLIAKGSVKDDPSSPSNFRPIALTSCIGKIFTSILKSRWSTYMLENEYLDPSIQKAFMRATPGCTKHHLKLASILADAKRKHKSLTVAWLDLANAYSSVHHSLIDFALHHYHAPSQFCNVVASLYSGLSARVSTDAWTTPSFPFNIGVYQGDPLSGVIFNTVINTLVDTLNLKKNLGYCLSPSHQVNLLQYADDTCIIASSPAAAQSLLDSTSEWLQLSDMKAKVSKCHYLHNKSSSGTLTNPHLTCLNEPIRYVANRSINFLGLPIQFPKDCNRAKSQLKSLLQSMLEVVDETTLTRKQKVKIYSLGICPRLNWLLTIYEFSLSWVKRQLEATATKP